MSSNSSSCMENETSAVLVDQFPQLFANDKSGICYLDHAGATLPSQKQLSEHILSLQSAVLGNPHSGLGQSENAVNQTRDIILDFFGTNHKEYTVIFTSGATQALKLVGECFDYGVKGCFGYTQDNHTSVVGMREYALRARQAVVCVKDSDLVELQIQNGRDAGSGHGLFAYPAQSNFSGYKYPLNLTMKIKQRRFSFTHCCSAWYVLVDASSFVSTSKFTLADSEIDFVSLSFYKIFGYPTGLGALIIKNSAISVLHKIYFGGGSVEGFAADSFFHYISADASKRFEDGTLPFQQISALKFGFEALTSLGGGMSQISATTFELVQSTYIRMQALKHYNFAPVIEIYAKTLYTTSLEQGPVIAFNVKRSNGDYVGFTEVQRMASLYNIQFRTGCFCNIGACQYYLGLTADDLRQNHQLGHKCGDDVDLINGRPTGAIRISFGYMSTYKDVQRLITFLTECYVRNKPAVSDTLANSIQEQKTLSQIYIYPLKSCAGMEVTEWEISETGLSFDRMWIVVSSNGTCLSQKKCPQLCRIKPTIDLEEDKLVLHSQGFQDIAVPLSVEKTVDKDCLSSVNVCGDKVQGIDCGDNVALWISSVTGCDGCRLMHKAPHLDRLSTLPQNDGEASEKLSMTNDSQFLLITKPSLLKLYNFMQDEMNTEANVVELIERFRPNLVIDGGEPDDEINWSMLKIGAHQFQSQGECLRCAMISIDQTTGDRTVEPLRSLSLMKSARATFGIKLRLRETENISGAFSTNGKVGKLKVGDLVHLDK